MPTSEDGLCEILFSETFLSLYWQARLQLLNCGLPWQFIMRTVSESGSPCERRCSHMLHWVLPTLSQFRAHTHTNYHLIHETKSVTISLNHTPPESGL